MNLDNELNRILLFALFLAVVIIMVQLMNIKTCITRINNTDIYQNKHQIIFENKNLVTNFVTFVTSNEWSIIY